MDKTYLKIEDFEEVIEKSEISGERIKKWVHKFYPIEIKPDYSPHLDKRGKVYYRTDGYYKLVICGMASTHSYLDYKEAIVGRSSIERLAKFYGFPLLQ